MITVHLSHVSNPDDFYQPIKSQPEQIKILTLESILLGWHQNFLIPATFPFPFIINKKKYLHHSRNWISNKHNIHI